MVSMEFLVICMSFSLVAFGALRDRSETGPFLQTLGVSRSLDRDLRGGVYRSRERRRARVRPQPLRCFLPGAPASGCPGLKQSTASGPAAKRARSARGVGTVERRVLVDLSREEAFTEGTEWNEPDPEFFEGGQQFLFRASPPQRV